MKIAFLTPEYPHHKIKHSAGLGTSIKNLTEALIRKGIKVTVFVYGQKEDEVFVENNINFHLIGDRDYAIGKWFYYRKCIQKYINRVIEEEEIQLLEVPDWTGISAFMKFDVPVVMRFHGSDTYFCHLENRKQKLKNRFFETLAVRNAQAYIAPTDFAGKVSSKLFGIKTKAVKTIHNGLELHKFQNDTPDKFESGLLLYIGTIIRKKGVFELPSIFHKVKQQYPKAKLVLIGSDSPDIASGSESTWELLRKKFEKEDLSAVTYLGKIAYQDVQDYIAKANVCLFPTFAETLGMVTIESMAMKKAVVNTNIGWAQELIIDGENGFLVHPTDHNLYAKRIIQLLKDDSLCMQIGKQALTRVEDKFDINKLVLENIEFYEKIINQNIK